MTLCRHFGSCGGCTRQNLSYEEQLIKKEAFIKELFPEIKTEPIVACTPPWNYRNKMELTFAESREGRKLGMYAKKHVFDLEECGLTPAWFPQAIEKVRKWWHSTELHAYYPPRDRGFLRTLTLRQAFHTNEKMVILHVAGHEEHSIEGFADLFEAENVILRKQHSVRGKPTYFEEIVLKGKESFTEKLEVLGKTFTFEIKPSAFFQPNPQQAQKLYSEAIKMAEIESSSTVFDLFCGTGALGMFAALHAKEVIGVELNPDSVQNAHRNAQLNGIENIQFLQGDVGKVIKEIDKKADVIVVDPPRSGLSVEAISYIKELKPKKLLYISCNPMTQKEDIEALGMKILKMQPVDQFPHTDHLENIALLTL